MTNRALSEKKLNPPTPPPKIQNRASIQMLRGKKKPKQPIFLEDCCFLSVKETHSKLYNHHVFLSSKEHKLYYPKVENLYGSSSSPLAMVLIKMKHESES